MIKREIAQLIKSERLKIDAAESRINEIAKEHIPDFHFLNYRVSTFWNCEKSPIGMCVFTISGPERKDFSTIPVREQRCRYCGAPVERK